MGAIKAINKFLNGYSDLPKIPNLKDYETTEYEKALFKAAQMEHDALVNQALYVLDSTPGNATASEGLEIQAREANDVFKLDEGFAYARSDFKEKYLRLREALRGVNVMPVPKQVFYMRPAAGNSPLEITLPDNCMMIAIEVSANAPMLGSFVSSATPPVLLAGDINTDGGYFWIARYRQYFCYGHRSFCMFGVSTQQLSVECWTEDQF